MKILLTLFVLFFSSSVVAEDRYCSGDLEVREGNKYLEVGKSKTNFGIEFLKQRVIIYNPGFDEISISLVSEGKYLETNYSVDAKVNKFFIDVFQSNSIDGDEGNISGVYHYFLYDKIKNEISYSVQSWNHQTRDTEYDSENYTYSVNAQCELV